MTAVVPGPGDFAVVSVRGAGGRLIHLAEDLDGANWDDTAMTTLSGKGTDA